MFTEPKNVSSISISKEKGKESCLSQLRTTSGKIFSENSIIKPTLM